GHLSRPWIGDWVSRNKKWIAKTDQTQGLQRIGSVSTMVRGSPDDALAEIRAKAVAAKADYYVVVMVDETI
ncbi:Lipoprotein BsmA, partial [human gut metagenome]